MKKTAVVILNYNGERYLKDFLPSVVANSPEAEIIVADNASRDGSIAFLKEHFPQLRRIEMTINHGFSKGYNVALQEVQADIYVLLNSDVETPPGWLSPLVAALEANPEIAACQPKMKAWHDKSRFEYAGACGGFVDHLGYPFCRGRLFDKLETDIGQFTGLLPAFWASGACLAIRSKVYHALGGFDDGFFAHMEEIDLCWRIRRAGYQVAVCADSEVFHVGGGTLSNDSPFKLYLNFRNSLLMLLKNSPSRGFWPRLFFRLCLDGVAAIRFLVAGEPKKFKAVFDAHLSFYGRFRRYWAKRKELSASLQNTALPDVYPKSIVAAYFLKGIKTFEGLGWIK